MTKKFRKMFSITMGLCRAELIMPTFVFHSVDVLGKGHDDIIFKVEKGICTAYFSEDTLKTMGQHGLAKIKSEEFVEKNKQEVEKVGNNLWNYSMYVGSLPLKHIENKELLSYYTTLLAKIRKMFGYFHVSQPPISFAIENELNAQMTALGISANEQYIIKDSMLKADRTTLLEREEEDLLTLALQVKRNRRLCELFKQPIKTIFEQLPEVSQEALHRLQLHESKYSFMASSENFDEFDRKYYIERIKKAIEKSEQELISEIERKIPDEVKLQRDREKIINKHKLPLQVVHLLNAARIYSHQRMLIRIYWTKGINLLGKILREVARRSEISEIHVQYLTNEEIARFLSKESVIDYSEVEERKKKVIYAIFDRENPVIYVGKKADVLEQEFLTDNIESKDMINGTIASKGITRGKVKVLVYGKNMVQQIEEMEHGDILVTGNTRPDMMQALHKASAVVTDEGGICSHAALVSREFGIPCVVGTTYATKIFKDGDIVEVDANKGIVKKIQRENI